jgi:hypothetical protein
MPIGYQRSPFPHISGWDAYGPELSRSGQASQELGIVAVCLIGSILPSRVSNIGDFDLDIHCLADIHQKAGYRGRFHNNLVGLDSPENSEEFRDSGREALTQDLSGISIQDVGMGFRAGRAEIECEYSHGRGSLGFVPPWYPLCRRCQDGSGEPRLIFIFFEQPRLGVWTEEERGGSGISHGNTRA